MDAGFPGKRGAGRWRSRLESPVLRIQGWAVWALVGEGGRGPPPWLVDFENGLLPSGKGLPHGGCWAGRHSLGTRQPLGLLGEG